jgi:hypothetical protein
MASAGLGLEDPVRRLVRLAFEVAIDYCSRSARSRSERGSGDSLAINTAQALLEDGQAVAIYPEGQLQFRSVELVGEPHSGAGRLALQTGARILPVAMVGTDPSPEGFLAGDREAAKRLVTETSGPRYAHRSRRCANAQR